MFRAILLAIVSLFILAVFRMIAGALTKGVSEMMNPQPDQPEAPSTPRQNAGTSGGALKRDPVCGMFVPKGDAVTKQVKGEPVYFCSVQCRDRYQA